MPKSRAEMAAMIINSGVYLERMLGTPALPGLALVEAHYNGWEPLNVSKVAARVNLSEDTCRRHLNALVAAGRARKVKGPGKVHMYCIDGHLAGRIMRRLADMGASVAE